MENNFYVGIVHHKKRLFKPEVKEKLVLYSDDIFNFLDLKSGIWYTTNSGDRDYVKSDTLVPTDVSLYRDDYLYMLSKYKESGMIRKKKM